MATSKDIRKMAKTHIKDLTKLRNEALKYVADPTWLVSLIDSTIAEYGALVDVIDGQGRYK